MEIKREDEKVRVFDSSEELSSDLADYVFQVGESAVKERGSFSLVLSGGDIPHRLGYVLLYIHILLISFFVIILYIYIYMGCWCLS